MIEYSANHMLMPASLKLITSGMVNQDEPEHRRLRNLAHKAFTPPAMKKYETRSESLTRELLALKNNIAINVYRCRLMKCHLSHSI